MNLNLNPAINNEEAINFLQQLIKINSVNPPGNEEIVAKIIGRRFESLAGCKVEFFSIAPGRSNIEIFIGSRQKEKQTLLLTGHLDTVAPGSLANWNRDPFSAEIEDDKLYGRGSSDMKSGVAALLLALEALLNEGAALNADIIFLGTVGEEVDSVGARSFFDRGFMKDVGAVIVAEPTNGDLGPAHKGALWLRLSTKGRTAHGSTPELGVNAISHMLALVEQLEEELELAAPVHSLLKPPTFALTTIEGGVQTNVIPDSATATLDIRTVPGLDHTKILERVEKVISKLSSRIPDFQAGVTVLNDRPPVSTPTEAEIMLLAQKTYRNLFGREPFVRAPNYYTDASALSVAGNIPTLIYGPGNDKFAHQPNEYVSIPAYLDSIRFFYHLIRNYGE